MNAIKFDLSGAFAMFKKPDVNSYAYFTYNNIHKVALLGIFGAILGLEGYHQQSRKIQSLPGKKGKKAAAPVPEELAYPEFYQKLKDLKVAIIPKGDKGYFTKKIQVFNNSVGYASKEEGGNLIVREQWLENPRWTIFMLENASVEPEIMGKLREYLLNRRCEFIPYLGKNDHAAVISDVERIELEDSNLPYISSLFPNEAVQFDRYTHDGNPLYLFKEVAPYRLNESYNFYEYKEFTFTNQKLKGMGKMEDVYRWGSYSLAFF